MLCVYIFYFYVVSAFLCEINVYIIIDILNISEVTLHQNHIEIALTVIVCMQKFGIFNSVVNKVINKFVA